MKFPAKGYLNETIDENDWYGDDPQVIPEYWVNIARI